MDLRIYRLFLACIALIALCLVVYAALGSEAQEAVWAKGGALALTVTGFFYLLKNLK